MTREVQVTLSAELYQQAQEAEDDYQHAREVWQKARRHHRSCFGKSREKAIIAVSAAHHRMLQAEVRRKSINDRVVSAILGQLPTVKAKRRAMCGGLT